MKNAPPIVAIVGPTASGKTELAVDLALRTGSGEIVNCDSVQIYREIEIATAKPSQSEMRGVPHHLLDYVPPNVNYTTADWVRDAVNAIEEIESRGRHAILAGGTGLYLRSLRVPLFESPPTDETLRNALAVVRERKGPEYLHRMLEVIDAEAAKRLFPKDYPRVQRALEYCLQTGTKFSSHQPNRADPPEFAERVKVFALEPPREELYRRINVRTANHFREGLVDEVEKLRGGGLSDESTALGSHGYRRVCEYLRGERSLESAIEKTRQDVRNYAKRQFTWFRKEEGVVWLKGFGSEERIQQQLWDLVGDAFSVQAS